MLTCTFCCFDGMSASAERRLWSQGCLQWRELEVIRPKALSAKKLERVRAQIREAESALQEGLWDYFLNRLPYPDKVKVLPHVLEEVGYLDIETTGLGSTARVTTVALARRGWRRAYVRGINLHELPGDLSRVSLLVTYNGASFDLPKLRKAFRIDLATPHVDLRYCLGALGYRGGLKECEARLGLLRAAEEQLSGLDAVGLWKRYEEGGDKGALLELVRYNLYDALALEYLAAKAYNLVMSSYPRVVRVPVPEPPCLDALKLQDVL